MLLFVVMQTQISFSEGFSNFTPQASCSIFLSTDPSHLLSSRSAFDDRPGRVPSLIQVYCFQIEYFSEKDIETVSTLYEVYLLYDFVKGMLPTVIG